MLKNKKHDGVFMVAVAIVIVMFWVVFNTKYGDNNSDSTSSEQQSTKQQHKNNKPNILGHKLNKSKAKLAANGSYYVERGDNSVRYFVSGGKITALKYIMNPANNTIMVQDELSNLLHDDNLKYTSTKRDESDIILNPKHQYNVWSPKNKQWYNISMQANGEKFKGSPLVSQFSVWEDKNPDAI